MTKIREWLFWIYALPALGVSAIWESLGRHWRKWWGGAA